MQLGVGLLGRCVMDLGTMATEQETSEFCWERRAGGKYDFQSWRETVRMENTFFFELPVHLSSSRGDWSTLHTLALRI